MNASTELGQTPPDVVSLFGDRLPLIERFATALSTSGVERGLLGPREVPRIWHRHIMNCAVVSELMAPHARVADVGSGAGLPGVVLAIARPDLPVTLIEPLLRRTSWLTEVVAELSLDNVELVRARAEEVVSAGTRFDVVTARAVARLAVLVPMCLPLVERGGQLLAIKGIGQGDEMAEANTVLKRAGATASLLTCGSSVADGRVHVVRVTYKP